jgi:hypothetical protein
MAPKGGGEGTKWMDARIFQTIQKRIGPIASKLVELFKVAFRQPIFENIG